LRYSVLDNEGVKWYCQLDEITEEFFEEKGEEEERSGGWEGMVRY